MSRPAVRVRSSALHFSCKSRKNEKPPTRTSRALSAVRRSSANLLRSGVQLKSRDRVPLFLCTARISSAEDNPRTPATKATVALPKKELKRCERAATSGVSGAGSAPDSTGVAPSRACRAILIPEIADARVVRSAPPSRRFFMPTRVTSMSLSASLRPPSLHIVIVTPIARTPMVWKRAQASLRTHPHSLLSLMCATLGLRAISPKIPKCRPRLCS
jgi:hypothetical protein